MISARVEEPMDAIKAVAVMMQNDDKFRLFVDHLRDILDVKTARLINVVTNDDLTEARAEVRAYADIIELIDTAHDQSQMHQQLSGG